MKKITIKIASIMLIMILIACGHAFAADNEYTCELVITQDTEQIKEGESVTYTVKVTNIKAGAGITVFSTILDYDSNVFDCKTVSADETKWTKSAEIEKSITMIRTDLEPNSEDQEIAKITFTAKPGVTAGKQAIGFTKIEFAADEDKSFTISDKIVDVNIVKDSNPDNTTNNTTNNDTRNDTNNDTNNNTSNENTEPQDPDENTTDTENDALDEESSETKRSSEKNDNGNSIILPFAGNFKSGLILLGLAIIVVAIVFYRKYKYFNKI